MHPKLLVNPIYISEVTTMFHIRWGKEKKNRQKKKYTLFFAFRVDVNKRSIHDNPLDPQNRHAEGQEPRIHQTMI